MTKRKLQQLDDFMPKITPLFGCLGGSGIMHTLFSDYPIGPIYISIFITYIVCRLLVVNQLKKAK